MGKAIKEKRNKHSSCDDITANYSDGKNCRAYRICFFFFAQLPCIETPQTLYK